MSSNSEGSTKVNLVEQILQQGQRLRNAMVESILTNDPLFNNFTARPPLNPKLHAICMNDNNLTEHEFTTQTTLAERELTTPEKHKFLAYLRGDEMTTRDEKQALETFRAMSNSDICEITQRSFTTLQNKCDCDTCKAYKNLNLKFDVPPLDLKSSRLDTKSSCNEDLLKYVDTLKIAVHSLRLNHEGDVKVSSSFNKSSKNVRMSESLAVTYFIEYDVPSVIVKSVSKKAKVDTGLGNTNVVKLCSKKLHNEAIYFKQISIHDVANLDQHDLYNIDIKFTVSCRCVRQKGVNIIGYAKFNVGSFLEAENFSCNQDLVVYLKESTPVVLGRIKIGLQLGAGRLYYGKEFLDSIRNSKESNKILTEIVSCEEKEDFAQIEVHEVPKEVEKNVKTVDNRSINKEIVNVCKGKNRIYDKQNSKESTVRIEDPTLQIPNRTILFGFIYVSEVEYLDTKESTYFTCQPFCQTDLINSSPVSGGANPIFNFQQKIPIIYEEAFISKLRDNFMVFEFWEKRYYKDELIGVCSIPLHQYYLAFRNPVIVDYLNRNKLPVIGTDWYEPISHPTSGTISGQVLILIALGSETQISNLEKERGFKDNIVTRAKRSLITKRPLINEPLQLPEKDRVTFKSLRQKLNSAKEILETNKSLDETYTNNICEDDFRIVNERGIKQRSGVSLIDGSYKKNCDKCRLVEDKRNSTESEKFDEGRLINNDNLNTTTVFTNRSEKDREQAYSIKEGEEIYTRNINDKPKIKIKHNQQLSNNSEKIKILEDRIICSGKTDDESLFTKHNDKHDKFGLVIFTDESNVDSFRLCDRRKVKNGKVSLARNKENIPGNTIRRVFFEDGEVLEKDDVDYYDRFKNYDKLNQQTILILNNDKHISQTENVQNLKSSQSDLSTISDFKEKITDVELDKTVTGGLYKTVVYDSDKTISTDLKETSVRDVHKAIDDFNVTEHSNLVTLQTERSLEIKNTNEYSCNSRQSSSVERESNFNNELNVNFVKTCDKSTQKSDTLDKGVQYEEIMEDNKKSDALENLLQQLITARQTNITSNVKPTTEPQVDNINTVTTPLTINTNCNSPLPNVQTHDVKKTVDLLDTLNRALSIDCSPQLSEHFKAHIVVESALHLPSRVKCKARKGKGGRSSTEKILPSTYVTFETDKDELRMTHVVQRSSSPKWDYRCDTSLPSDLLVNNQKRLIFKVWKKANNSSVQPNMQVDSVLGFAAVDLTVLLAGLPTVQGWFNIVDFSSKCNGQIKITVAPLENISRFNLHKNNSNKPTVNLEPPAIKTTESQDEPGELLSRALKRKFIELDEITQRLRSRLSNITNEESDTSNDGVADEFEKDINTLCVEDDFDMLNFVREVQDVNMQRVSDSLLKWQGFKEPDNQTLMVFTGDEDDTSVASCSKTIESIDCAHLDQQLAEGKNRIDTLLQKLSLIPKGNERKNMLPNESNRNVVPGESEISGGFSSRYVSGCSDTSRATLRTSEEILLELGVKDADFNPNRLLDADLLMKGLTSSSESSMRDAPDGEGEKKDGN